MMGTGVIFLDMDGVVNSDAFIDDWIADHGPGETSMARFKSLYYTHDGEPGYVVPELVDRLKSVCDRTGCRVVWSSSWRQNYWVQDPDSGEFYFDYHRIRHLWEAKGLPFGRFAGCTPCLDLSRFSYVPRGCEIQEWLNENAARYNIGRAAILDDNEDAEVGVQYENARFFQTTFERGLTEDIAESVVDWLNEGKERL